MSRINGFRDLIVYQKAYKLAMDIYEVTKNFPKEEKYSLTDQIRRSSRSVSSGIAESWAKRRYIRSFISKFQIHWVRNTKLKDGWIIQRIVSTLKNRIIAKFYEGMMKCTRSSSQ